MIRKTILIILGSAALCLAGIGVLLPVLPTTPFVLCAAGCFAGSCPGLYRRLANTRYFGEYIQNYKSKTGISPAARWAGIASLWATLLLSTLLSGSPVVMAVLAVVGIAVSVHILTIRRACKPKAEEPLSADTP